MLLSLLPGVRSFRTPLTTGLIWLLVAWIVLEPHIRDLATVNATLQSLGRLSELYGAASIGAVTLFLAYLVGILLPFHWITYVPQAKNIGTLSPSLGRRRWMGALSQPVNESTAQDFRRTFGPLAGGAIDLLVDREGADDERLQPIPLPRRSKLYATVFREGRNQLLDSLANRMLAERETLAIKLRIAGKEMLFQAYDAKDAEAQFRRGLIVPISALIGLISWSTSAWFLILTVVPISLSILAQSSQRDAMSEIFQAVIQGQIESTAVTRMKKSVSEVDLSSLDELIFIEEIVHGAQLALSRDFGGRLQGGRVPT